MKCVLTIAMLAGLALLNGCDASTPARPSSGNPASALSARPPLRFVEGYASGAERARTDRRPMLVFFTAPWCAYCREFASDALADAEVAQLAGEFTCIQVDAERESDICNRFRVNAFPTVQFFSADGIPLNRVVGKSSGPHLARQMRTALDTTAHRVDSRRLVR